MSLQRRFRQEVATAGLPATAARYSVVTDSEVASLPEAVQRYFRFMRVVGRPRDWSFRLGFTGRFRSGLRQPWRNCEAWQYNHCPAVARIFHIRIRFAGVLPVIGRDTYINGRGRMLIRLLDLVTVEDATGSELDTGELVTYLNDAVMLAPAMLLAPGISWVAVDADSFDVSLTDHGRTVTARVSLAADGSPKDFSTVDRFCAAPDGPKQLVRARWTTPIAGWQIINGRPLPTRAQAVWHLPAGPFAYADFRLIPTSPAFNVLPNG